MKTILTIMILGSSSLALASASGADCLMQAQGNDAPLELRVSGTSVSVKVGGGEPDSCSLVTNPSYDLLARCGSGEDAVYYGVQRESGRVYGDFGTIASLRQCRLLN